MVVAVLKHLPHNQGVVGSNSGGGWAFFLLCPSWSCKIFLTLDAKLNKFGQIRPDTHIFDKNTQYSFVTKCPSKSALHP